MYDNHNDFKVVQLDCVSCGFYATPLLSLITHTLDDSFHCIFHVWHCMCRQQWCVGFGHDVNSAVIFVIIVVINVSFLFASVADRCRRRRSCSSSDSERTGAAACSHRLPLSQTLRAPAQPRRHHVQLAVARRHCACSVRDAWFPVRRRRRRRS